MSKLSICAISDIHGVLPVLNKVDVVVICGDIIPLQFQKMTQVSESWLLDEFKTWVRNLPCEKVIITPGNHDFYFGHYPTEIIKELFRKNIGEKLVLLIDELYEYKGVTFYGCPWCDGPQHWAFCPSNKSTSYEYIKNCYKSIPHCDVLITHQPPKIGNLGVSYYWDDVKKSDWSSEELRKAIVDKDILVNFCGHIHSGDHTGVEYPTPGCNTIFYNVSILDENYCIYYPPTYVNIDTELKTVEKI